MPGIPTHFQILDLTLAKATGLGDLTAVRQVMQKHPEWANLGAIGPAIADFIPGDRATNPLLNIWSEVFSLIGDGMRVDKGLLTILKEIRNFFTTLDPIIAAEDLAALDALPDAQVNLVSDLGSDLQAIFNQIPFIVLPIGVGIMADMRPAVNVAAGSPVPPSRFWELRNYLFWKKPGAFAQRLYTKMRDSGDERFLAYAYGYLIAYAANTVGSPFVASSIRGPYRTQWWRHHWVNNYVDAWVWGKYEAGATMAGDTPTPPYDQWPNLCDADLHTRIALAQHDPNDLMVRLNAGTPLSDAPIVPTAFGELWLAAFNETYAPGATVGGLTAASLNDAYLMTWLVLWFQTASDGLGCNVPPSMTPPDGCGDQPPWVDPEVSDDMGTPTVPAPPEPEIESDVDEGQIITGILLALLGLGLVATGNAGAGGALIVLGIKDVIAGANDINWGKLRCTVHWYRLYIYHALTALHEILSVAAFRYPTAGSLAEDETMPQYFGAYVGKYDSGKRVTMSRPCVQPDCPHPARPWTGGFNWMNPPTSFEPPYATAYRTAAYPSFFVDDAAANPLANGEVRIPGVWPVRIDASMAGSQQVVQFGNAVDNAIDVLRHRDDNLPNWNLDADRGLAYHTWEYLNGVYLDPLAIQPEP